MVFSALWCMLGTQQPLVRQELACSSLSRLAAPRHGEVQQQGTVQRSKGAPVQKPGLAHGGHCQRVRALVRPQAPLQGLKQQQAAEPAPPSTPTTHRSVLSPRACARHALLGRAMLPLEVWIPQGFNSENNQCSMHLLDQAQRGLCPPQVHHFH